MFDSTDGLTLFGEARFGSNVAAWLGLRRHFGGAAGKDMINRDREDLAPLWLHLADDEPAPPAPIPL